MDFLRSNNLVRLIAFILAVMLWIVVRTGSDFPESPVPAVDRVTETITGTAEVLYAKERVSLVGEPPEVTVKIHGDRLAVLQAKMQINKVKFIVDARDAGEGVHQLPVQIQGLPPGVVADTQTVAIRLEPNLQQRFPVNPVMEGVQDAAKMAAVRLEPQEVTVTGPASLLRQVQQVQARVPAQILESPGKEQTVSVFAVNDKGRTVNVSIQPKTVDAVYEPVMQQKVFTRLQAEVKGLAKGRQAVLPPEGITLTLEGSSADLEAVRPEDIKILIDVTGLAPGEYVRDATLTLPANVRAVEKEPLRVPVKIVND